MKGIILLIGGHDEIASATDAIVASVPDGRYVPNAKSSSPVYGAIVADLMAVLPGDRIFFFLRRGIYGVGRVAAHPSSPLVGAWIDAKGKIGIKIDAGEGLFLEPLDMDEALMRPGNEVAAGLRTMGGKNFFQLDPDEGNWLEEQFYRRRGGSKFVKLPSGTRALKSGVKAGALRALSLSDEIFESRLPAQSDKCFSSENFLHAAVIERLKDAGFAPPVDSMKHLELLSLHHEYPASPAKQAIYVDRIDAVRVFGSRLGENRPVASFYDCWEMKKDSLSETDFRGVVLQVMKYADFIASSRLAGDYSRVRLHIVAKRFPGAAFRKEVLEEIGERRFQLGVRESASAHVWSAVECLEYSWSDGKLMLVTV